MTSTEPTHRTPKLRCPDCDPVTVARPLRYGSRLVLCPAHSHHRPQQPPAPLPVKDDDAQQAAP